VAVYSYPNPVVYSPYVYVNTVSYDYYAVPRVTTVPVVPVVPFYQNVYYQPVYATGSPVLNYDDRSWCRRSGPYYGHYYQYYGSFYRYNY
jgi:hypothetical protein